MIRKLTLVTCFLFIAVTLSAGTKEENRLTQSGVVMQEILDVPDNIPQELLQKTECVIVLPSVKKAAFIFGGSYGRGAMVCRTGKDFNGPWGAPAMYALEGGSFGAQIGGQATDVVLLVMNRKGADSILDSKVKLGAGVSVAAGPKGRDAQAATDAYMGAEILAYSRSRGLFAGISLQGSTLRPDNDASSRIYGRKITAREIVLGNQVATTAAGRHLVGVLQKGAQRNQSDQASTK
ncbi:MAG TPA: lipid-binding SYLF domain-containing protein [Desulfurivibrionaceae bacterium]